MGNRSEDAGNTVQSPYANSSDVLCEFSETNTHGNKLTLKDNNSLRLMFENKNDVPLNMGYCLTSLK